MHNTMFHTVLLKHKLFTSHNLYKKKKCSHIFKSTKMFHSMMINFDKKCSQSSTQISPKRLVSPPRSRHAVSSAVERNCDLYQLSAPGNPAG